MGSNRSKKADASMPILYHKILQGGEALPIGSAIRLCRWQSRDLFFIAYVMRFVKFV